MTEALWTALITIGIPAAGAGLYRLWRDRRADRTAELADIRAQALTQARLEALEREAKAAVEQKNAELALKDGLLAERDATIADLARRNERLWEVIEELRQGRAS